MTSTEKCSGLATDIARYDSDWNEETGDWEPLAPEYLKALANNLTNAGYRKLSTDDATVERIAAASWAASDGYVTGIPWPPKGLHAEKERRRVRAMLAVLTDQLPYVGQHVEWNYTGDEWKPGLVREIRGEHVHIVLADGQDLLVERRHLAWGGQTESEPTA
ncbi:hypothetical protein [Amycolatopsis taiwanensis]|uniref:hypothetical protein n=1 Tax=Amycolatopsis taiwanensis TaxID=342230 RepID=UPI000480B8F6|nr:hypothetical protein [Amycolatopsis taiwanensis]